MNSINDSVQLVNFWATGDLNRYLNLRNRVEARMALVDVSTTSSDNILLPNEIERLATARLNYRDKQLLRLKDEILDLEDFNESIALNDFSLDDFRAELSELLDADHKEHWFDSDHRLSYIFNLTIPGIKRKIKLKHQCRLL